MPLGQANDALGYMPQTFELNPVGQQGAASRSDGVAVVNYEDAYSIDRCFGDMALETAIGLLGGPADIDLSATVNEFPGPALRVQDGHRDLPPDLRRLNEPATGEAYPQTLADLIAFDPAHPELEGPWNDLVFEFAEETNGRDADCAALREATTPPVQAAIDQLMAETTSTQSSR